MCSFERVVVNSSSHDIGWVGVGEEGESDPDPAYLPSRPVWGGDALSARLYVTRMGCIPLIHCHHSVSTPVQVKLYKLELNSHFVLTFQRKVAIHTTNPYYEFQFSNLNNFIERSRPGPL